MRQLSALSVYSRTMQKPLRSAWLRSHGNAGVVRLRVCRLQRLVSQGFEWFESDVPSGFAPPSLRTPASTPEGLRIHFSRISCLPCYHLLAAIIAGRVSKQPARGHVHTARTIAEAKSTAITQPL